MSRDELLALVADLQRQIAALTASNEALRAELEQLKRSGKRQAAPLSKGTRATAPKRPGRKPGSGPFRYRDAPPSEAITEPPVEVKVTLDGCLTCGGPLEEVHVDFVYTTEIPQRLRPKVTQYRGVGVSVHGQHPAVAPDQAGGTAHRLGPRVMAAAHTLHYAVGRPVRKVSAVLHVLPGVQLTKGALTQDVLRRAAATVGTAYEHIRAPVPPAPWCIAMTPAGGWVAGPPT